MKLVVCHIVSYIPGTQAFYPEEFVGNLVNLRGCLHSLEFMNRMVNAYYGNIGCTPASANRQ